MKNKASHATAIQIFNNPEFGAIRTTTINGEPMMAGINVAKILGYENTREAIRDHVDEDDRIQVQLSDFQEGSESLPPHMKGSKIVIINESGFYSLILRSNLPQAKKIKKWVTSEVLPSIRKHGGYMVPVPEETAEETMARALLLAQKTIEAATQRANREEVRADCFEEQNRLQTEQLQIAAPIIDYHINVLQGTNAHGINIIAKGLGMSGTMLNKILKEKRVLYRQGGQWLLYAEYQDKGYTKTRTHCYTQRDGTLGTEISTVWTEKGRLWIHELLTSTKSN